MLAVARLQLEENAAVVCTAVGKGLARQKATKMR